MTDKNQFIAQLATAIDATERDDVEAFYDTARERGYIAAHWQDGIVWHESAYAEYPADWDDDGEPCNVDVIAMYRAIMSE